MDRNEANGEQLPDAAELLRIASLVAGKAGALAYTMRANSVAVNRTKSSELDIVTEADIAVEKLILGELSALRPDDGFIAEESGVVVGTSQVTWVIDPIDGTVNYLYGSRYYAVSIAATVATEHGNLTSVAGCVYAPAMEEKYTAARGGAAHLNGKKIQANQDVPLANALVSTDFTYDRSIRHKQCGVDAHLAPLIRDLRRGGTAALEICAVAAGRSDAHFQQGLPIWDYAAAGLIAECAGAVIVGPADSPPDRNLVLTGGRSLISQLEPHLSGLMNHSERQERSAD